ncbi:MAG: hypothetical protein IIC71_08945, partial [Acidobacteria bacterium]|nr:hypothetical protein [Acidobacteriota bacterium]
MIPAGELRPLFRIAWRNVRKNPWRNLLVSALIALPVFGLTFAQIVVATATPSKDEMATGIIGNADAAMFGSPPSEETISLLPEGVRTVVRTTWEVQTVVGGRNVLVIVNDVLPEDPLLGPMYKLLEGRSPAAPGEIAVAPRILENFDSAIGETIELGEERVPFEVVGVAVYREGLSQPTGLVAPGALDRVADARQSGVFIQFSKDVTHAARDRTVELLGSDRYAMRRYVGESPSGTYASGMQFAATAVALVAAGLIIGTAFEVSTRRQLRLFGLVGATGGEPRHVF